MTIYPFLPLMLKQIEGKNPHFQFFGNDKIYVLSERDNILAEPPCRCSLVNCSENLSHYMILFIGVCVLSCFSHIQLLATPWTAACQTSLSMEFSRQEYWSGLPCLPPVDLPHPGIKPTSLKSPALAGRFFTTSDTWEAGFFS